MNFSIVFKNTGDMIPFESIHPELLEYYVDYIDKHDLNSFLIDNNSGVQIQQVIGDLKNTTTEINQWADKIFNQCIPIFTDQEYLDQHNLNRLHADWVNSQYKIYDIQQQRSYHPGNSLVEQVHNIFPDDVQLPVAGSVISRLGLVPEYNKLNLNIHRLENQFSNLNFKIDTQDWVQFNNPFDKSILTNNLSNLRLKFNHLGRTLFNKYQTFDTELQYNDENSFDELLGFVTLSLVPAQTIPLSIEYLTWCKQHNKVPSGDFLNIGNIPDLYENLTNYRIIIFRNLLSNNSFSIRKKGK